MMWDVFKVRRMMMLFDEYGVCGAGTKRDIFYLHNLYVNNFVIYFHLYDWLKQGGERPTRTRWMLFGFWPGNASQLERSF